MLSIAKLGKSLFGGKKPPKKSKITKPVTERIVIPKQLSEFIPENSKVFDIRLWSMNIPELKIARLNSSQGELQIVHRSDHIVDLGLLNTIRGDRYKAIETEVLNKRATDMDLVRLPAIPQLSECETIIDETVCDLDRALLNVAGNHHYCLLDRVTLNILLNDYTKGELCIPIVDLDVNGVDPFQDVEEINARIRQFTSLKIRKQLRQTLDLPPLPIAAKRLLQLRGNINSTTSDLVAVVQDDASLSANVLRWSRSALYGGQDIKTLDDAIGRILGYDMTMNLLMGITISKAFPKQCVNEKMFKEYWSDSLFMAHTCIALAAGCGAAAKVEPGVAYLCGLMHNLGYIVIGYAFPNYFEMIHDSIELNNHLDPSLIEHHVLGITREQIGSELLKNWELAEEIVLGVRLQKSAEPRKHKERYATLSYIAKALLTHRGITTEYHSDIPCELYDSIGLDPSAANKIVDTVVKNRDGILKILDLL